MTESWSETTLHYWMMLEIYPYLKEEVGRLIFYYEIFSLLDKKKLVKWSTVSCALALACRPSVSKIKENENKKNNVLGNLFHEFKLPQAPNCIS